MLTGRTGAQAVPRAGIWETSRDFPALDGSRQDPAWCRGALRDGRGWSGHWEARRFPVLPRLAPPPSEQAGDAQPEDSARCRG